MKKYYLYSMMQNLTEESRELLQKIYEPRVVAIPPCDVCRSLCVTPDGELRIYGSMDRENPTDRGTPMYLSSRDCGLSWTTHLIKEEGVVGCAGYNPHTGRYIAFYPNRHRMDMIESFGRKGTWVILNDEGFDSTNNRYVLLSEKEFLILKTPIFLESCNRWFILGQYTDENRCKHITVSYSDDDGESWVTNILEKYAPLFKVEPPHKGVRWQQYSCEPTMVETAPGELLMFVRTSQNYHYMYKSQDCGETWTGPEQSSFHGTITMPVLYKLEDGRILFFWCNTEPLPELDHELTRPSLDEDEKQGVWEEVFTNRDANHMAISEDGGKTWKGMREIFLNAIRNNADFRSVGGNESRDKSVHQGEMLELPYNKLLLCFGQNQASRRTVILDIGWLYEQDRHEDFRKGLGNVSTHMYVKSNLGNFRGFSGHCAYNRTNGALLVPDPDENFEEALQICRIEDERLVYKKQGVVWNFPASAKGMVSVKLRVLRSGVAISLSDHWYNPCDENVRLQAPVSIDVTGQMCKNEGWSIVTVCYDTTARTAEIRVDSETIKKIDIKGDWPNGFSYLHIQTLAEELDMEGTLIKELNKNSSSFSV